MTSAKVNLWGRTIGAVTWEDGRELGYFQYTPEFARSGIQISPISMPLRTDTYSFPALPRETFFGLPGLLSDSLPDKYGNRLIDEWLAFQGRSPESFNPVERLCYVGRRGMGALEFEPERKDVRNQSKPLQIEKLVELASKVLSERDYLKGVFDGEDDRETIEQILRVGTSAGGARAKAVLAWNPKTGEFRSGQLDQEKEFQHWLLKFDGVSGNRDRELADPQGYGLIEYAYSLMAKEAGIEMMDCRIHEEGGRHHFMTRRFDRTETGEKLHMQSLCAIAHYDYKDPASYSYEQAIQVMRKLNLSLPEIEQQYVRTLFNLVARNQDDHVKNIAFLMDKSGAWRLSPAFDVIYSWNPSGAWTSQHQMSVNGKRDNFSRDDLLSLASAADIKKQRAIEAIEQVKEAVSHWPQYAQDMGIEPETIKKVKKAHRLAL